jgi:O-antigen/teichoic acid export membrane protein
VADDVIGSLDSAGSATGPEMETGTRHLITGSTWVFLTKVGASLAGLVSNALLARLVAPEVLGEYFLSLSVVMFGTSIAQMGLKQTIVQVVASSVAVGRLGRARGAILRSLRLAAVASVVVGGVIAFGAGRVLAIRVFEAPRMADSVLLLGFWVAVLVFQGLLAEIFRGLRDLRLASLFESLFTGVLVSLFFLGALLMRDSLTLSQALTLSVSASGTAVLSASLLLRSRLVRQFSTRFEDEPREAELLNMAWPFLVTGVLLFFLGSAVDLWIVGAFGSTNDVALYGAAARLGGVVGIPVIIMAAVLPPFIAEMNALGKRAQLERILRAFAGLSIAPAALGMLVLLLIAPWVMGFLFGDFYRQAAPIFLVLGAGQLFNIWAGACGSVLMMTGHQRTMMGVSMVGGGLTVGLALGLVNAFGAMGVALSTAAGLIIQNVLMMVAVRRRVGISTHARFSFRDIRDLRRTVLHRTQGNGTEEVRRPEGSPS